MDAVWEVQSVDGDWHLLKLEDSRLIAQGFSACQAHGSNELRTQDFSFSGQEDTVYRVVFCNDGEEQGYCWGILLDEESGCERKLRCVGKTRSDIGGGILDEDGKELNGEPEEELSHKEPVKNFCDAWRTFFQRMSYIKARVQHRSYVFEETGRKVPYAVFVPSSYSAARPAPLMVGLHGLLQNYDTTMYFAGLTDMAEAHGIVLASPLGYARAGWYGSVPLGRISRRSEQDVMNVLQMVSREFSIDEKRTFLWGHSMGGRGTLHLAKRHPDLWAAIGISAPCPSKLPKEIKSIPVYVIQGNRDVLLSTTRMLVRAMKALNMNYVYEEVPGMEHCFVHEASIRRMVHFFLSQGRGRRADMEATAAAPRPAGAGRPPVAATVPRTMCGRPGGGYLGQAPESRGQRRGA